MPDVKVGQVYIEREDKVACPLRLRISYISSEENKASAEVITCRTHDKCPFGAHNLVILLVDWESNAISKFYVLEEDVLPEVNSVTVLRTPAFDVW